MKIFSILKKSWNNFFNKKEKNDHINKRGVFYNPLSDLEQKPKKKHLENTVDVMMDMALIDGEFANEEREMIEDFIKSKNLHIKLKSEKERNKEMQSNKIIEKIKKGPPSVEKIIEIIKLSADLIHADQKIHSKEIELLENYLVGCGLEKEKANPLIEEAEIRLINEMIKKFLCKKRNKIAILGDTKEKEDKFKKLWIEFLNKYKIDKDKLKLDFFPGSKLKKINCENFKRNTSRYILLVTGNIHTHNMRGNKSGDFLKDLKRKDNTKNENSIYVNHIVGCSPKNKLKFDDFKKKFIDYL